MINSQIANPQISLKNIVRVQIQIRACYNCKKKGMYFKTFKSAKSQKVWVRKSQIRKSHICGRPAILKNYENLRICDLRNLLGVLGDRTHLLQLQALQLLYNYTCTVLCSTSTKRYPWIENKLNNGFHGIIFYFLTIPWVIGEAGAEKRMRKLEKE